MAANCNNEKNIKEIESMLAPLHECLRELPREICVVILAHNNESNVCQTVVHCESESESDKQKESFSETSHESILDAFIFAFKERPVLQKIAEEAIEWINNNPQVK